ncbi:MAG: hypothetical protein ABFD69_03595 [Candidatus Sumerlaeia bacterium]
MSTRNLAISFIALVLIATMLYFGSRGKSYKTNNESSAVLSNHSSDSASDLTDHATTTNSSFTSDGIEQIHNLDAGSLDEINLKQFEIGNVFITPPGAEWISQPKEYPSSSGISFSEDGTFTAINSALLTNSGWTNVLRIVIGTDREVLLQSVKGPLQSGTIDMAQWIPGSHEILYVDRHSSGNDTGINANGFVGMQYVLYRFNIDTNQKFLVHQFKKDILAIGAKDINNIYAVARTEDPYRLGIYGIEKSQFNTINTIKYDMGNYVIHDDYLFVLTNAPGDEVIAKRISLKPFGINKIDFFKKNASHASKLVVDQTGVFVAIKVRSKDYPDEYTYLYDFDQNKIILEFKSDGYSPNAIDSKNRLLYLTGFKNGITYTNRDNECGIFKLKY